MATAKLSTRTNHLPGEYHASEGDAAALERMWADNAKCRVEANRSDVHLECTSVIAAVAISERAIAENGENCNTATVDTCLRADGELARICLGLKVAAQFRYYLILHELSRAGAQGFTRQQFATALTQHGITNGTAYMTRLLRRGHGLFWHVHRNMIYPLGYTDVSTRIVRKAYIAGLHDLYLDNQPGIRKDVYIDVSGTADDFEAHILEAWYSARGNPTISRHTLQLLTNRDSRSLRHLEARAGIRITYNEAESYDPADVPLDTAGDMRSDVYRTRDRRGNTVYHWRLPNTYAAGIVRQHNRRGQGYKTANILKQLIENQSLAGKCGADGLAAVGKLNRADLAYCETVKVAKHPSRRSKGRVYLADRPGEGRRVVWRVYTTLYRAV